MGVCICKKRSSSLHSINESQQSSIFSNGVIEQFLSTLSVSFVCLSSGIFVAYTSAAVPSMKEDSKYFPSLSHHDVSWIGGLSPLGAMVGSLLAFFPIRRWGSRNAILFFAAPFLILSWLIISFAPSITWVFVGRFIGGAGGGIGMASAPLYVIEIADNSQRGRLGIMPQFLMIVGIWLSNVLGSLLDWRDLAMAASIISLPAVVLLVATPNSPAFYIARNRMEEAANALRFFRGGQCQSQEQSLDPSPNPSPSQGQKSKKDVEIDPEAQNGCGEDEEIEAEAVLMKQGKNIYFKSQTVASGANRKSRRLSRFDLATIKACAVALGLMSFQQLTGINGVTFYAVTIFKETPGVEKLGPYLPAIFLASTQCLAVLISTYFVERLGRKILLLISGAALSLTAATLSGFFYACHGDGASENCADFHFVPLVALICFVFGFAIGFGPLCWVVVTEILPADIRNSMNPIAIGYSWFCIFLVTKSFPVLMIQIQLAGIFGLFAGIGVCSVVFIAICLPETKGKTLDEIQAFFGKKT